MQRARSTLPYHTLPCPTRPAPRCSSTRCLDEEEWLLRWVWVVGEVGVVGVVGVVSRRGKGLRWGRWGWLGGMAVVSGGIGCGMVVDSARRWGGERGGWAGGRGWCVDGLDSSDTEGGWKAERQRMRRSLRVSWSRWGTELITKCRGGGGLCVVCVLEVEHSLLIGDHIIRARVLERRW